MANHRTHDDLTKLTAVAWFVAMLRFSIVSSLLMGGGILIGGYFLSPDLDVRSRPYRRWKLLRWWWHPYQKLFRHRGFFTHTPLLGSAIRLFWTLPLWLPVLWLLPDYRYGIIAVIGIEVASIVHLITDQVS